MSLDAREVEVNEEIEGRVEERERQIQERERQMQKEREEHRELNEQWHRDMDYYLKKTNAEEKLDKERGPAMKKNKGKGPDFH